MCTHATLAHLTDSLGVTCVRSCNNINNPAQITPKKSAKGHVIVLIVATIYGRNANTLFVAVANMGGREAEKQ